MAEGFLTIEPDCAQWPRLLADSPGGQWQGRDAADWRHEMRRELGLVTERPIVATGHQTLLWHPGILAKYLLVEAMAAGRPELATANLIVDQHTRAFGQFEVPVRRADGQLAAATVRLAEQPDDVPMGRLPPLTP